jgi:hypothetical protein
MQNNKNGEINPFIPYRSSSCSRKFNFRQIPDSKGSMNPISWCGPLSPIKYLIPTGQPARNHHTLDPIKNIFKIFSIFHT